MPRIIRKETHNLTRVTGRFTDGSDRVETPYIEVLVVTDEGPATFDHDPSDDEVLAAFPRPVKLAPTATAGKAALKELLDAQLAEARDWEWFAAKVAVDAGVPANAKTAVQGLADAEYAEAKRLALAWRAAT